MYKIVEGDSRGLSDVDNFIGQLNDPPRKLSGFFDRSGDIFLSRAPGRLDIMGGIGDYSGSLVLEMPIAEATMAAVQKRDDTKIRIVSISKRSRNAFPFEMDLSELFVDGNPREYPEVRACFADKPAKHWASYAAGVFFVLSREKGVCFQNGARILVWSDIPIGKGVSSSAALEVAVMGAVCAAYDVHLEPRESALLCQKVENHIVGASCGVMDQMSTTCGIENALVSILCQPAEIRGTVSIPDHLEFWGIDSGVRHAVVGSDYASVRVAAFMGYRMIAEIARFETRPGSAHTVEVDDPRWNGYLCNVNPREYEAEFREFIPATIGGAEFIDRYGGTTDTVTKIDSDRTYDVKAATEHAIYENFRVAEFGKLLRQPIDDRKMESLGQLMFECHASYAACGLTEPGTDRIAELVRESRDRGLFGARITGGGSGGTVAILARKGSRAAIDKIAAQYERETSRKPYIFLGSSPGAADFGFLKLGNIPGPLFHNG